MALGGIVLESRDQVSLFDARRMEWRRADLRLGNVRVVAVIDQSWPQTEHAFSSRFASHADSDTAFILAPFAGHESIEITPTGSRLVPVRNLVFSSVAKRWRGLVFRGASGGETSVRLHERDDAGRWGAVGDSVLDSGDCFLQITPSDRNVIHCTGKRYVVDGSGTRTLTSPFAGESALADTHSLIEREDGTLVFHASRFVKGFDTSVARRALQPNGEWSEEVVPTPPEGAQGFFVEDGALHARDRAGDTLFTLTRSGEWTERSHEGLRFAKDLLFDENGQPESIVTAEGPTTFGFPHESTFFEVRSFDGASFVPSESVELSNQISRSGACPPPGCQASPQLSQTFWFVLLALANRRLRRTTRRDAAKRALT